MSRALRLATLGLAVLWPASEVRAQVGGAAPSGKQAAELAAQRGAEGPLDNDAFLSTNPEANAALASFDRTFVELRESPLDAGATRRWTLALDELERALRDSRTGDCVAPIPTPAGTATPWNDPDGTADPRLDRRREGVELAVLRRLRALKPEVFALWSAGAGVRGEERRARAARDVAALRDVERNFPCTRAALLAALALSDAELERAAPANALRWLERARKHAEACGMPATKLELRETLARAELEAQRGASVNPDETWRNASKLESAGLVALDEIAMRFARPMLEPGIGLRAGMCFLDGGRAVVHIPSSVSLGSERLDRLVLIDLAKPARISVATPLRLFEPLGVQPGATERPVEPPGWALAPASDGRGIVTTLGRRSYDNDNVLAAIDFVEISGSAEPPEARLRWAWQGGTCVAGPLASVGGSAARIDWGAVEFQPGAIVQDGAVYVLVREYSGGLAGDETAESQARTAAEIRSWVACFDVASGALRWRTFLGKGSELQRSAGRFFSANLPTAAAAPLVGDERLLFAGTHTGFGSLCERLDGRIDWSFKVQRRDPQRRSWSTGAPVFDALGRSILWAPMDSDHLYWLRAESDLATAGLLAATPRRDGEAEVLVGGDADGAVVLARIGAGRAAAGWEATSGATALAPELGPAEKFSGEGLTSPTRALFATNRGLYVLDRTKDLYLVDYAPLAAPADGVAPTGGSVHARGDTVCVLGVNALWVFRAR
ncbi:MAG: hypothetical protein NTV21_17055 [Planctomycetota bacterium]|nr:hypothetical protein [Planctomycetota bacterium]